MTARAFGPPYSSKAALCTVGGAITLKDRLPQHNSFTEKKDASVASAA